MPSKQENDELYMGAALLYSKISKAKRAKVGAVLVTANDVVIGGVNGQPIGMSNECEDVDQETGELITKQSTIHAELNAVLKAAKEGVSCLGAKLYVTLSPCLQCSAMLVNAGISEVIYKDIYRDTKGIELLTAAGVVARKYKEL